MLHRVKIQTSVIINFTMYLFCDLDPYLEASSFCANWNVEIWVNRDFFFLFDAKQLVWLDYLTRLTQALSHIDIAIISYLDLSIRKIKITSDLQAFSQLYNYLWGLDHFQYSYTGINFFRSWKTGKDDQEKEFWSQPDLSSEANSAIN